MLITANVWEVELFPLMRCRLDIAICTKGWQLLAAD